MNIIYRRYGFRAKIYLLYYQQVDRRRRLTRMALPSPLPSGAPAHQRRQSRPQKQRNHRASAQRFGGSLFPLPAWQLTKRALVGGDTQKVALEWANEQVWAGCTGQIAGQERSRFPQYW